MFRLEQLELIYLQAADTSTRTPYEGVIAHQQTQQAFSIGQPISSLADTNYAFLNHPYQPSGSRTFVHESGQISSTVGPNRQRRRRLGRKSQSTDEEHSSESPAQSAPPRLETRRFGDKVATRLLLEIPS